MTIATIEAIREARDQVKKNLRKIKISHFENQRFGPEGEYNARTIVEGVRSVIIDITTLTKAPVQFIKISTQAERNAINTYLNKINSGCVGEDLNHIAESLDNLKTIFRPLLTRLFR